MDDVLEKLRATDPEILTTVVRQDLNNPAFEITHWSVSRLNGKGIINPDDLWLFSGEGQSGGAFQTWSVVLKILQRPEQEAPPEDRRYWKRELLFAQSQLLEQLPGPVKSPRFYHPEETPDGAWIWQEHVQNQRPDPWSLDDYAFVAHQLGLWNGAFGSGEPLPDEPWLTRKHYHTWYSNANPEQDFQFALNQKYIYGDLRARYERLWAERDLFYRAQEMPPQTFSHFDSQRRNSFIRKGNHGRDELVLVDWADCGLGPLGAELFSLIGMSAGLLEWSPSKLAELDRVAFDSYLQGLREAGWSGNAETIRLAYTAWITLYFGVVFPNIMALWCASDFHSYSLQRFGFAGEELYLKWLPLLSYSLDRADEARGLLQKLS